MLYILTLPYLVYTLYKSLTSSSYRSILLYSSISSLSFILVSLLINCVLFINLYHFSTTYILYYSLS